MVAHLSEEWLALQAELGADLPPRPGATARLQFVVAGAPDGEVAYHQRFEDGRLVECALGTDADADVTLAQTYADAVAVASGDLPLSVAYMQGRVKVVGDVGALLAVMGVLQSAEHRALVAASADRTDLPTSASPVSPRGQRG